MALFGRKNAPKESEEIPAPTPGDLGVVIHVMPKDFYGTEAMLRLEPKQITPPAPAPAPVIAPVAPPIPVPMRPARRTPVFIFVIIGVLLLVAGGAIAYVFLGKAQPQQTTPVIPPVVTLPTPDPVEKPPVIAKPEEPVPSKDTDSDGLTDIEERMYGTDARNPDSDKDTFLDGNEVFHRYDPNGLAPSTLLDTGAVKVFSDATLPFTVYYPTSWRATVDAAGQLVTMKTPNLATVTLSWSAKATDLTVEDWILANVENVDIASLKSSYTVLGYYTLRSKDDLVAYLDLDDTVYVLTYALNDSEEISYLQTFAMMVNSFHIAP